MRFVCRSFRCSTWECEILLVWALSCFLLCLTVGNLQLGSIFFFLFFFPESVCFSVTEVDPRITVPLSLQVASSFFFFRLSLNFGFLELDIVKGQQSGKQKKKCPNEVSSWIFPGLRAPWVLSSSGEGLITMFCNQRTSHSYPQQSSVWLDPSALRLWVGLSGGGEIEERNALLVNKVGGRHQWASVSASWWVYQHFLGFNCWARAFRMTQLLCDWLDFFLSCQAESIWKR